MYGDGRLGNRRQQHAGPACAGTRRGDGRGKQNTRAGGGSLGGRTATRTLTAVGVYVVQDLRDTQGLTRPMLRRAARRLALSRREPVRRLGNAYLRLDPAPPDAGAERQGISDVVAAAPPPRSIAAAPGLSVRVADAGGTAC
jgi:hypothetical protein